MNAKMRRPFRCALCLTIVDNPSFHFPNIICATCFQKEHARIKSNNKKPRLKKNVALDQLNTWHWIIVLAYYNFACMSCGIKGRQNLTIDHIISVKDGGHNTINNVQPLCTHCHAKKDGYEKIPRFSFQYIRKRFKKYFKRLIYKISITRKVKPSKGSH